MKLLWSHMPIEDESGPSLAEIAAALGMMVEQFLELSKHSLETGNPISIDVQKQQ